MDSHKSAMAHDGQGEEHGVRPQAAVLHGGIHVLPNELLAKIFQTMVDDSIVEPSRTPYLWVSITRVSRLWRGVAVGCATLWTHITPTAFPAIDIFLSRSSDASLTFAIDETFSSCPSDLDRCLSNLHRTRELCLRAPAPAIEQFIAHSYPKGASRLRSLFLFDKTWIPDLRASRTYPAWITPLPSLSTLSVCQLTWQVVTQMVSPSIRYLHLIRLAPLIPPSALRSVLSSLPSLETLIVHGCLASEAQSSLSAVGAAPVLLQHLVFLCIDQFKGCPAIQLLRSLRIPIASKLHLRLGIKDKVEAMQLISTLRADLDGRLGPSSTRPRLATCWLQCRDRAPFIRLLPSSRKSSLCVDSQMSREDAEHSFIEVEAYIDSPDHDIDYGLPQMLVQHLSAFGLAQLTALRLDILPIYLESCDEVISMMVNVESLSISDAALAATLLGPRISQAQIITRRFSRLTSLHVCPQPYQGAQDLDSVRTLFEVVADRRLVPGVADLQDLCLCVRDQFNESDYSAVQGHRGEFARLDVHH